MKEFPLISVIIPCFNSELWIAETLSSVFAQTYKNVEVIVVDDGSTDNTKEIVLKYGHRISYYYQQNKGPSAARNLGIKNANGEYIAFLDSDDLWEIDKLNKQVNFLEKNKDVHLVFSNVTLINEKGVPLYTHHNQVPFEKKEIIRAFFEGEITMNTPTILARKDSIVNIGSFDEGLPLREDHFFLMSMTHQFKIKHFREPLVRRRISQSSMSNSIDVDNIFKLNEPFIKKSIEKFPYLSKYRNAIYSKMNASVGRGYWKLANYKKGLAYIGKAISHKPFKYLNYVLFILILFRFKYENIENIKWNARTKYKKLNV